MVETTSPEYSTLPVRGFVLWLDVHEDENSVDYADAAM